MIWCVLSEIINKGVFRKALLSRFSIKQDFWGSYSLKSITFGDYIPQKVLLMGIRNFLSRKELYLWLKILITTNYSRNSINQ